MTTAWAAQAAAASIAESLALDTRPCEGAVALAITHFSQRYADPQHLREAREVFAETVAVRDLDRVRVPRRR